MTTELSTMLALIAVVAIAVAAIGVWWINRTPAIRRDAEETLPLFTSLGSAVPNVSIARPVALPVAPPVAPAVASPIAPSSSPSVPPPFARPSAPPVAPVSPVAPQAPPMVPPFVPPVAQRPTIREFRTAFAPTAASRIAVPLPSASRVDSQVVSDAGVPGTMVEGHAVRFSVPAEGTLQFLPGRLEIGSGVDAGREIRFVHVPGPDGTAVTFGRTDGPLYRHIQLRDKTVSRQHAELQWRNGHWYLRNHSQTNPVARNNVILDTTDEPCLQDGDRIEMGEVIFTFRSR